ncbi:serine hydrolase domain-containing protein [Tissierella sp.]|uniref:Beta-lactamase family protein n=2 Tax=Tissierella carlieri TaxID=689904 RepID=A0ABT1S5M5_9FIRM|nr:beta-lactamase family protein [Tissierella carlieri]
MVRQWNKDIFLLIEELEANMYGYMKNYAIPGLVIGMIEDGNNIWVGNYGFSDISNRLTVQKDTCFQVGSISKTVTALGVMKLAENGNIDIDMPVNNYLKTWNLEKFNYGNGITIKHLLTHTSGLPMKGYLGYANLNNMPSMTDSLDKTLRKKKSLNLKPGVAANYTGIGYTVLQLLIEDVTGMPFETYMDTYIFKPLDMKNTTYDAIVAKNMNLSCAYGLFNNKIRTRFFIEKAAAGLYSTINDMMKFLKLNCFCNYNIRNDTQFLKLETLNLMHTKYCKSMSFGLGYNIDTLSNNRKLSMHRGINNGWTSHLAIFPKNGNGLVIMTNSNNGINIINKILKIWLEHYNGKLSDFYLEKLGLKEFTKSELMVKKIMFLINRQITL